MRSIEDDPKTTAEKTCFESVGFLAEKFRHYRLATPRRNVMIVVFTDEAGDDVEALDATVDVCRKYEMPVYVIGVPAPFGRETAYVKYVDPDPKFDQSPQRAPVHQGPESLMPERIMLLFGGRPEDEEQMDSGFGPFGLCRLAYETGGLYFTVHPNRETGKTIEPWETAAMSSHISTFFDERVMRNYRPEYVPAQAVLRAAQVEQGVRGVGRGVAAFGHDADGKRAAAVPADRRRPVCPRPVQCPARLRPSSSRRSTSLVGHSAARRTRSRQSHDAALAGRLTTWPWAGRLAVKVRTEGYNAMLADRQAGPEVQG